MLLVRVKSNPTALIDRQLKRVKETTLLRSMFQLTVDEAKENKAINTLTSIVIPTIIVVPTITAKAIVGEVGSIVALAKWITDIRVNTHDMDTLNTIQRVLIVEMEKL